MNNEYPILSVDEILVRFNVTLKGLPQEEVEKRQKEYGPNMIRKKEGRSFTTKFLLQLRDWFSILLFFASLLSFIGGMWQLGAIILVIIFLNTILSLFQEFRAEKAMESLKHYIPEYTKVMREGKLQKLLVKDLVPGDLIILNEGDRVPADARLIEAFDLAVNNIPLTGESEPQQRTPYAETQTNGAYLDASNLVFMSTSIAKGQGKAIVIDTGKNTKFGQIARLTSEIQAEPSPLQKEIENLAKRDFIIALILGGIFFLISFILLQVDFFASILFFIGVMVSCVPEGLQVTVSSALAINVLKMTKQNVLIKRLSAVQTLGSVSIICTDKTGTITKGEMTVTQIYVANQLIEVTGLGSEVKGGFNIIDPQSKQTRKVKRNEIKALDELLEIGALCNEAKAELVYIPQGSEKNDNEHYFFKKKKSEGTKNYTIIGDPTDGALLVVALKYGLNLKSLQSQQPIIQKQSFDSVRRRMTTVHKSRKRVFQYTKGSPYGIMDICKQMAINDHIEPFTAESRAKIEMQYKEFARTGLRILGFAYKEIPEKEAYEDKITEENMIFVGLVAMKDPPRSEVKDAILVAKQAGVKVVMITGDSGPTSQVISEEVGITEKGKTEIIRGEDLPNLGNQGIVEKVKQGNIVFARVSPEQKLQIVKALKQSDEIIAVTGDGANDAPSLKEADIGIAMGIGGTDVAREAADMILLNDNFASIVKAIRYGRGIYDNIRKFIVYVFSHNWAELIPFVLYILIGIPLPLLVIQVLAIDLFIDIIPSLALSREPPEPGIMREMPRSIKKPLFDIGVFFHSLYIGAIIATGALIGCLGTWIANGWWFGDPLAATSYVYIKGTTMTFAAIVVSQIGNLLGCRTNKTSIFKSNLAKNRWIFWSILSQIGILCLLIYIPGLQPIFGTTALNSYDWVYLITLPLIIIVAEELRKAVMRYNSRKK